MTPLGGTRGPWMALTAALLGWMFDGLEMGLFPLVARPALADLLGTTGRERVGLWVSVITAGFLVGAATGGVLFGWLGDRVGRVRAMTLSVLTYAVFSGLCALSTEAWHVAALRFVASLGMGGEWSLGVALVMETWPNRSRAWLAGVIGAAANFGYMVIAVAGLALGAIIGDLHRLLLAAGVGPETADRWVSYSGWRVLMALGAAPALLTFLIRLFVPESHRWQQERKRGNTSYWQTRDLVGVLIGTAAAVGMIALWVGELPPGLQAGGSVLAFAVITLGFLYPIRRYVVRAETATGRTGGKARSITGRLLLAAVLSGIALLGTWGSTQCIPTWVDELTGGSQPQAKAYTQIATAGGAVVGCVLAALLGEWFGRRRTYALLCLVSLAATWGTYHLNESYGPGLLAWGFVTGAATAAFYGWLPLYLPELFPTRVRATGQGFGFNFGRVLAAVGVLQLSNLMKQLGVGWPGACSAISLVYVLGAVVIWFAPETSGQPLPD